MKAENKNMRWMNEPEKWKTVLKSVLFQYLLVSSHWAFGTSIIRLNASAFLPPNQEKDDDMKVTCPMETDFWRGTLHGFIKDDAPFYFTSAENDFEARLSIKGKFKTLYDQAGLMFRIDEENWVKLGICHYRDQLYVSCCFTRGVSDWSTHRLPQTKISVFHVWMKRKAEVIDCYYSVDNENWIRVRQGYFSDKPKIRVGMMCAAPESAGFKVTFSDFMIKNIGDKDEEEDDNNQDDDSDKEDDSADSYTN